MPRSLLFVHQGYELYGSDRTLIQSVSAAATQWPDARITVLLPLEGGLNVELLKLVDDVRVVDLAILRKSHLKKINLADIGTFLMKIRDTRRLMRSYDLTYINTMMVMDYTFAACLLGRPRILHVHELPTGVARVFFSTLAMWSGACVLCNSLATRRSFWLLPWQSSAVIWNGVAGLPDVAPREPHDRINFLLIGRINSWKGHATVLRAMAKLPQALKTRLSVRFVGGVFGNQDHFTQNLIDLIEELQLQAIVEMCPFIPDPAVHYAWADVVLVPSINPEPFGLVAIEAMAAGRCVIAARHGGLAEIVVEGVTGSFVTPGSVDSLAAAITTYVENPARAHAEGLAGRARFEQEFEESHYKRKIIDAIQHLCAPTLA